MSQVERARLFRSLHVKGNPLVLFNIWDAGSAKTVHEIGAKAIATGSWAVAAAHGFPDGEKLPFDLVIGNLQRITASVDLPVTLDMEGGYGKGAEELRETVQQVIEAGAIGINFEDQIVGGEGLYSIEEQYERIAAVRAAAEAKSIPLFINARTDIFLKAPAADHNEQHVKEAIERAVAYAEAGASGFFAPGLRNSQWIEQLCGAVSLPVNILVLSDTPPSDQLAQSGVARISYGAGPYRQMINALKEAGRQALAIAPTEPTASQ